MFIIYILHYLCGLETRAANMPKKVTINAIRKGGSTRKWACSSKGNGLTHQYTGLIWNLWGLQFVVLYHHILYYIAWDCRCIFFCKDSLTGATLMYLIHTVRASTEHRLTVLSLRRSQGYGDHINVINHRVGAKLPHSLSVWGTMGIEVSRKHQIHSWMTVFTLLTSTEQLLFIT